MIQLALSFFVGVLLVQYSPLPPPWWLALFVLPLLLIARRLVWARCIVALAVGAAWMTWAGLAVLDDQLSDDNHRQTRTLSGEIVSIPEPVANGWRFIFAPDVQQGIPRRLRVTWYRAAQQPAAGERWQLSLKLRQPRNFGNPGGFDYVGWLRAQGVGATAYVVRNQAEKLADSPTYSLLRLRAQVNEKIQQMLKNSELSGVVAALAVGERAGITTAQWRVVRRTGTAHLLAISGLHIGLLAGWVLLLVSVVWRRIPMLVNRVPATVAGVIAGLVAAAAYAAMAGFAVPTQRALAMVAVIAVAIVAARQLRSLNALAGALVVVLLIDPFAPQSFGFWLSFAAVASIGFVLLGRIRRASWWRSWLLVQGSLLLLLLPLMGVLFGGFAPLAPLVNLLAVPVFSFVIVPLVLLGSVLPVMGEPLLLAANFVLEYVWQGLAWVADWHSALLPLALAPWWATVLAVLGVLWLLAPRGWPLRGLGAMLLLPVLTWRPPALATGEFEVAVLDVGQGFAAVVRTREHVLVFDTGPAFRSGTDTGALVVNPFLQRLGVQQVDKLVISHGDNDHAGGAQAVLAEMQVQAGLGWQPQVVTIPWRACQRGDTWMWDGVRFDVLHPGKRVFARDNNQSCVIRVSSKSGAMLLTGDIEQLAERDILAQVPAPQLRAELLFAPHHGSKSSSSFAFVQAVQPRWVIAATGFENRFGFPHVAVQQRYAQFGADLLTTAEQGAIQARFTMAAAPQIHAFRPSQTPLWWR